MTPLSRRAFTRRAFATTAGVALLAGCSGQEALRISGADGDGGSAGPAAGGTGRPNGAGASASTGKPRRNGRPAPVRLRIPAIGVDTPVVPLGLAPDGTVEVPPITADDPAGWYRHSPAPGETGPSVILGHVTVGSHGDGVFRHLARLRGGDRIVARLEGGGEAEFAVGAVRTVAKDDFPTEEVYGNVDRPELRLITCGGPRAGGEYRDNVIVFAGPVSPARR
ncbi:class F sortase [Streptomyces zingiberis]|uniref:Class F sortase n=1 Tax=Streptomyces zingiberis TaxID=2053010 RepID=A0ABX1BNQ0_9ACTN|nr:class F sortase [Streptomyces zingiberis]NJP99341.1 class F sortase [Streptomyces zingiberis]